MASRRNNLLAAIVAGFITSTVATAQPATQPADARLRLTFVYARSCDVCASTEQALNVLSDAHAFDAILLERVDADAHPARVAAMQVTTTPTLRVTDADGQLLATASGPTDETAIRALLATAAGRVQARNAAERRDDLSAAMGAVESDDRDARDRAIEWLATRDRDNANRAVIDRFATSTLRGRLALLEVLRRWSAPVAGLDPWRPETIGPVQLEALRDWAQSHDRSATQPSTQRVSE